MTRQHSLSREQRQEIDANIASHPEFKKVARKVKRRVVGSGKASSEATNRWLPQVMTPAGQGEAFGRIHDFNTGAFIGIGVMVGRKGAKVEFKGPCKLFIFAEDEVTLLTPGAAEVAEPEADVEPIMEGEA